MYVCNGLSCNVSLKQRGSFDSIVMKLINSISLVFFNSLLKSCIQGKNPEPPLTIFRQLLQFNLKPNDLTFSLLLKLYASSPSLFSVFDADQIRTHLVKSGVDRFVYVTTATLDLYMKLNCVKLARWLFDEMPARDVVAWNALICGYSRNGYDFDALESFVQMLREGFSPRETTLVGLIPSCVHREFVFQGKSIHGFGIKAGIDFGSRVKNAFTSMYAKCADLGAAELLFGEMVAKDVVSWNTMIGAYGQNCCFDEAMLVFNHMRQEGVEVNSVTLVSLLLANANPETLHCFVIKTGLIDNDSVLTSLICAYARFGRTKSAEWLHWSAPMENLISLTAIISSYVEKGSMELAVACFSRMQRLQMKVDAVAMVSILHGFTDIGYMDIGVAFHGYALKSGLCTHSLVANGLITMYSKFNDVEAMFCLFSEMYDKPLTSWNSLISGCVQAGQARNAMEIFYQMNLCGHTPDDITIASLLTGCSQLGDLQLGEKLHGYLLRNNLPVEDFVGTALIDMYAKCGSIEHAERVFNGLRYPCLATWNAMISGYSLCGFEHKALACYSKLQEQALKPDKITFLGVLSACTHAGLVHEGRRYFKMMAEEFSLVPNLQHLACMVGLLGRAGLFKEALHFIKNMKTDPDSAVWGALLSACCIHREVKLGECLAKKLYLLDHKNGGLYILMSNLYAVKGMWDDVERVREMMKDAGGDGFSGVSHLHFREVYLKTNSFEHSFS